MPIFEYLSSSLVLQAWLDYHTKRLCIKRDQLAMVRISTTIFSIHETKSSIRNQCFNNMNGVLKNLTMTKNKLLRMDNVGIVVESLDDAISFFSEVGLRLEGRGTIEGEWAGRVTGLGSQCVEIAMMVTPDGHSRLELSKFLTPATISDHRTAPVNALGYLRVMFTVEDIDEMVSRLQKHGAQLVGDVVQYENSYRLCYIRGTEGILIGLAQEIGGNNL
jgi:catechol 2,3-dioxygenase-like lactoylglutathione lyase family enzyme